VSDIVASGMPELWRGIVNTWECDENRHMNVRFYTERLFASFVRLAFLLGLPRAYCEDAPTTLLPRDMHLRFMGEAFEGQTLSVRGGVVALHADTAEVYHEMVDAASGRLSATIRSIIQHVEPKSGAPVAWPADTQRAAEALRVTIPKHGQPRTLDIAKPGRAVGLRIARELGLPVIGLSTVTPRDCDVFGRMRPEGFFARQSDSIGNTLRQWRTGFADLAVPNEKGERCVGGALLEKRLLIRKWPRAGHLFETRGGLVGLHANVHHFSVWHLDPVSGEAWSSSESIAAGIDLTARKILTPTKAMQDALMRNAVKGLGL